MASNAENRLSLGCRQTRQGDWNLSRHALRVERSLPGYDDIGFGNHSFQPDQPRNQIKARHDFGIAKNRQAKPQATGCTTAGQILCSLAQVAFNHRGQASEGFLKGRNIGLAHSFLESKTPRAALGAEQRAANIRRRGNHGPGSVLWRNNFFEPQQFEWPWSQIPALSIQKPIPERGGHPDPSVIGSTPPEARENLPNAALLEMPKQLTHPQGGCPGWISHRLWHKGQATRRGGFQKHPVTTPEKSRLHNATCRPTNTNRFLCRAPGGANPSEPLAAIGQRHASYFVAGTLRQPSPAQSLRGLLGG
jgi:hypothetical protein